MPHPDVALLKNRDAFQASAAARPDDCLLIIDVADSSLIFECERKLPQYAKAGVAEVWLAEVNTSSLNIHRDPEARKYAVAEVVRFRGWVQPGAFPDVALMLDQIFGS